MGSRITCMLVFAAVAVGGVSWAQESSADPVTVGKVKTLTGSATLTTSGAARAAQVGSDVFLNDLVETGAESSLGIVFDDESRVSLGPDTSLSIDEFVYVPQQNEGSFISRLARGSVLYVSGLIAKLGPEAAKVETPVGTLGVRGTRFLVRVAEDPES